MRIKDAAGNIYEGPDGPVPAGYTKVEAQPQPKPQGPIMSSPRGFYGPGIAANIESRMTGKTPEQAYQQRVPQLETAAGILAPMVLPGGKAATTLGTMGKSALQGAGISGGLAALGGKGAGDIAGEAALGAGAQAAAVPLGAGLRYLFSAIPAGKFARATAGDIAGWLQQHIPDWSKYSKDSKGLYEMAHGTGQRTLSNMYEKALVGAKSKLPQDAFAEVPQEVAKKLGIKDWKEAASPLNPNVIGVRASELLDKLPGLKTDQGLRRTVINALDQVMPEGVIPEARQAYKTGMGWIDFAEKGKFLKGESYDPVKAMAALDTVGKKTLLSRGMDPVAALVRGPMEDPMRRSTLSPWAGRMAAAGLFGGGLMGGHGGVGALGGAGLEALNEAFRPSFYKNVPPTAASGLIDLARRMGIQGLTQYAGGSEPTLGPEAPPGSMTSTE